MQLSPVQQMDSIILIVLIVKIPVHGRQEREISQIIIMIIWIFVLITGIRATVIAMNVKAIATINYGPVSR